MTSDVLVKYYCRETVKGLGKMAFENGKWTIIASRYCPGSMSLKYFIPLLFALSLVVMPLLCAVWVGFGILFGLELALYLLLDLVSSLQKTKKIGQLLFLMALFPIFHICYGIGSVCGFWTLFFKKN